MREAPREALFRRDSRLASSFGITIGQAWQRKLDTVGTESRQDAISAVHRQGCPIKLVLPKRRRQRLDLLCSTAVILSRDLSRRCVI